VITWLPASQKKNARAVAVVDDRGAHDLDALLPLAGRRGLEAVVVGGIASLSPAGQISTMPERSQARTSEAPGAMCIQRM
jgi:hypothetical protein